MVACSLDGVVLEGKAGDGPRDEMRVLLERYDSTMSV